MSLKYKNIAVVGATGFVGLDLINLLTKHPKIKILHICAQRNIGKSINFFDKRIKKKLPKISKVTTIKWDKVDVVFLSLPNGEAQKFIKKNIFHKHIIFIDLSGDFRLKKPNDYKLWYGKKHQAKNLIKDSLYAVSEFVKEDIKDYRIISNPGCYPTSIQLPLIPILKKKMINTKRITIDSKSGYSGAGKNFQKKFNHKFIFKSIQAYGIYKHKHMSELDQEFYKHTKKRINYTFNPHLLPTFRGILSSIYIEVNPNVTAEKITNELKRFYKKNKFIKIKKINNGIGTSNVLNTNSCEIVVCKTRIKNKLVIFSAIDNLIKGASGQAIQNMNLVYGFKESLGLI